MSLYRGFLIKYALHVYVCVCVCWDALSLKDTGALNVILIDLIVQSTLTLSSFYSDALRLF